MSINFPNAPAQGQTFSPPGGYQYIYLDGVWRVVEASQNLTALPRNRVVNPCFQISQEFGTTVVGNTQYPADQWSCAATIPGASSTRSVGGSGGTLNIYTGTAKPALTGDDYMAVSQAIEGIRVADFLWGSAAAKPIVVSFEAYGTLAGTYSFALRNGAADRSYVATFPLAASVWTQVTIPIAGDTTGTWPTTTARGMDIWFTGALSGSSGLVGALGWNAGNKIGAAGTFNAAAVINSPLYIRNVGLYLDPLNTRTPPRFEMPDEADEYVACCRYYERFPATAVTVPSTSYAPHAYKARKRIDPALAIVAGSALGAVWTGIAWGGDWGARQTGPGSGAADQLIAANSRM
jgi:hypothetical protein